MARTGLRFTLNVTGLPENTFVVAGFTLQEQYCSLFQLELELASVNPAVEFGKVLDSDVTLTVWRDEEVQRTVSGIVVSMEQGDTGRHQTRYCLSVRPALWRATLVRNSRIFQQQDLQAILETLLKEHGIQDCIFSFRYSRSAREFCVQYQEDDVSFIQRMAAEEGVFYFFEHHGNRHTLVFSDDCAVLNRGPELPYHPQRDDEPGINTLRRRESLRPSDVLLKDFTFKNPDWRAEYEDYGRGTQHQSRRYLHYDYPGRYKDEAGKQFSRWRMEALRNDAHQGEGASNCAALEPGSDFTLTHHPHEAVNTRWQITGVSHTGRQPQALEGASGERGTTLVNQFTFIPREQTWRPLLLDKPRIDGAQIAIVTGPPGEEIYCDEHGRIRVRFLWDRSGRTDDTSSCWIRVSHPWAGQGWGSLAIPRVGHEVIIEFLNGDPDQPVVIGRTYHATNTPQGKLPGTKTQMSIRSKTHKGEGFNELRFDDAKGNEEVFIHAQKDMNVQILNSKSERVNYDRHVSIGHDEELVVANNRIITVEKQQDVTVKANDIEKVQADKSLTVEGDLLQKINGNMTVDGNGDVVIESRHKMTLKVGNSFIVLHPAGIDINAPTVNIGHLVNIVASGSPSSPRTPLNPQLLKSLAGTGTPFVEQCPANFTEKSSPVLNEYQRIFIVKNRQGTPVPNVKYRLTTASGEVIDGVTDREGRTERVFSENEENVKLECFRASVYQKIFVLKDKQGHPVSGIKYKITADSGMFLEGTTGDDGRTEIMVTESSETVKLECYKKEFK